jgi:hypothetical protein
VRRLRGDRRVGIEEQDVRRAPRTPAVVAAGREAVVARACDRRHVEVRHCVDGAVGRGVVDDDHVHVVQIGERRDATAHVLAAVVCDDDDIDA